MSMLSSQADELRTLAGELRQILEYNADWTPAEAVTLSSSVDAMREAADTIEGLRDKFVLQNKKGILYGREQIEALEAKWKAEDGTCEQVLTDCDDGLMPPFTAHCSACGAEWGFTPSYRHNCGAKCTGTRDERKKVER